MVIPTKAPKFSEHYQFARDVLELLAKNDPDESDLLGDICTAALTHGLAKRNSAEASPLLVLDDQPADAHPAGDQPAASTGSAEGKQKPPKGKAAGRKTS